MHTKTIEDEMVISLPKKTPVRLINILQGENIEIDNAKIDELVLSFNQEIFKDACRPLEAKIINQAGVLTLPLGTSSGLKEGSIGYVVGGKQSWRILEVTSASRNSSQLRPISNIFDPKSLSNQTVRFIESAL